MDKLLRLIVIDSDVNDAETMISAIKSAGFGVRARHAKDTDDLLEALKTHAPDLVLHTLETEGIVLQQTLDCTQQAGKRVPVIAVSKNGAGEVIDCMQRGAVDLVRQDQPEHLKLIVTRTADSIHQWRELKRIQAALHEAELLCRTLLDSSRDAICYVHEGMFIYANRSYLDLFGYTELEDVEGTPIMDMVAPSHQQTMKDFLRRAKQDDWDGHDKLDIKLRHINGNTFNAELEFSPSSIDGEACTQIIIRDQTAQAEKLQQQVTYLSQRDVATGLYNRPYVMERLQAAIGQAAQGKHSGALILLEVRNLPSIKETIGAAAVDLVIVDLARLLVTHCDESDVVARLGSESFAILVNRWETRELEIFAEELSKNTANHLCNVEGKLVTAQIAMGAALIDEFAPDADEVLVRAEKAAQQAKESGDQGVHIYTPKEGEMTQKQLDESWAARLRDALKNKRLRLLFQPIVNLHAIAGERYEVYMQILDEKGKTIPAAEFLPSAERNGIAKELDRWVIMSAISKLAQERQTGKDACFFIKLSAGSLQDPGLLTWMSDFLRRSRVPPASIVFAIRQESIINHLRQAKTLVKGLQTMHCKFALTEFGTGNNPFHLLKYVSADYLKIDHSLMEHLSESPEQQEQVRSINDTAHGMNKFTIAPFVENASVLSVLWGIGVNYIQGNFLQKPSYEPDYDFSAME